MKKLKLEELNRASVAEFKAGDKLPIVIVLDNVRSMHNIGSVFVQPMDLPSGKSFFAGSPRSHRTGK